MNTLIKRTISGAVYVLIIILTIFAGQLLGNEYVGHWIFGLVFGAIGICGTLEVIRNLAKHGIHCNETLAVGLGIICYALVFCCSTVAAEGLFLLPVTAMKALPAILMFSFIAQLWSKDEQPMTALLYNLLPSLWVMVPLGLSSHIHGSNPWTLMSIFLLIWSNDTFAYLTGMLLGRHKMWQRHSPNKTWEGTIGGALCTIAIALIVGPLLFPNHETGNYLHLTTLALTCSVIGTLGDLVESMFKRYCGVKDSGNIMPGHGGILDRFDSFLMVVPFIMLFV